MKRSFDFLKFKRKIASFRENEVSAKLMQGAVSRASKISLGFGFIFVAYGFTSLNYIQRYNPDLTLWSNIWPRIAFNGIPFLFLSFALRDHKTRYKLKLWAWTISFPLIFALACYIHVWPLLMEGHGSLYLYVHAANVLVILMGLIMTAPPPLFLGMMVLSLVAFFVVPVMLIFKSIEEHVLLGFMLNDIAFTFVVGSFFSHLSYNLRRKLAIEDIAARVAVERYVGNLVSESIFENNEDLLKERTASGFILTLDVRGFTHFVRSTSSVQTAALMETYHRIVGSVVGKHGGFIHKSTGDGHLISFGLMNKVDDLTDVTGLDEEKRLAEDRKRRFDQANAMATFEEIFASFEALKYQFHIDQDFCVCGALDFGDIRLRVIGDPSVHLEFDLDGLPIIRCVRLESYTKVLREHVQAVSYLVLSQYAAKYTGKDIHLDTFSTAADAMSVKDFPEEKVIYYKRFLTNIKKLVLAA